MKYTTTLNTKSFMGQYETVTKRISNKDKKRIKEFHGMSIADKADAMKNQLYMLNVVTAYVDKFRKESQVFSDMVFDNLKINQDIKDHYNAERSKLLKGCYDIEMQLKIGVFIMHRPKENSKIEEIIYKKGSPCKFILGSEVGYSEFRKDSLKFIRNKIKTYGK